MSAFVRQVAVQALNRGEFATAERSALSLLAQHPDDADALLLAGVAAAGMGRLRDAIARLEQSVRIAPTNVEALAQLARCLSLIGRLADAEAQADQAMACTPQDALTLDTLGVVYSRGNAHLKACTAFRGAIALAPEQAAYQFNLASSLKFLGEFDVAEQAYEACLTADPEFWKAHSGLAQLHVQTPARNHLPRLQALMPKAKTRTAQVHLRQALAKEFEDLGDIAVAFSHLRFGKAAKRSGQPYSFDDDARLLDRIERLFAEPSAPSTQGHDNREPIFIVGMPRSGTTLVERILSSHPDVHSAGEVQNFARVIKQLSGTRSRDIADDETLERAIRVDRGQIGTAYLESTRPATGHTPHFIDKLPMNFLYVGFIARALPNAKIIAL